MPDRAVELFGGVNRLGLPHARPESLGTATHGRRDGLRRPWCPVEALRRRGRRCAGVLLHDPVGPCEHRGFAARRCAGSCGADAARRALRRPWRRPARWARRVATERSPSRTFRHAHPKPRAPDAITVNATAVSPSTSRCQTSPRTRTHLHLPGAAGSCRQAESQGLAAPTRPTQPSRRVGARERVALERGPGYGRPTRIADASSCGSSMRSGRTISMNRSETLRGCAPCEGRGGGWACKVSGEPDEDFVNTRNVESQNLTTLWGFASSRA